VQRIQWALKTDDCRFQWSGSNSRFLPLYLPNSEILFCSQICLQLICKCRFLTNTLRLTCLSIIRFYVSKLKWSRVWNSARLWMSGPRIVFEWANERNNLRCRWLSMVNLVVKCDVLRFNGELKTINNILSRFISTAFMWLHSIAIFLHVICLLNSIPTVVLRVPM